MECQQIHRSLLETFRQDFFKYSKQYVFSTNVEKVVCNENSNDFGLGDFELWYLRNKEKEEIDFLITENNKPVFMVETKLSQTDVSPHLVKFRNILQIPAIQLVNKPNVARKIKNGAGSILIVSAASWLPYLN